MKDYKLAIKVGILSTKFIIFYSDFFLEAEDVWKILFPTGQFDEAQVTSEYAQEDMGLSDLLLVDVKIYSLTPSGQYVIKKM